MVAFAHKENAKRLILIAAFAAFLWGIYLSLEANPELLQNVSLMPVVVMLLLAVPATLLLNGLEFYLMVRLVGASVGFASAMETTVIGSAANMLPLPGSAMVKVARLKGLGVGYKQGVSLTLIAALVWAGVSFTYSGAWLFATDIDPRLAAFFCVGGLLGVFISLFLGMRLYGDVRTLVLLVVSRTVQIVIDAARLLLCFKALGFDGDFIQASVLSISAFLGSAVSIVPAGLGIREGAAALIGPVVGLALSSAYLASAFSRILGLSIIAPTAFLLSLRGAGKVNNSGKVKNNDPA